MAKKENKPGSKRTGGGGGAFHQSILSVFFTDNCYKLLKSLHLIGWEQICQWKTLTKRLMKCPPDVLTLEDLTCGGQKGNTKHLRPVQLGCFRSGLKILAAVPLTCEDQDQMEEENMKCWTNIHSKSGWYDEDWIETSSRSYCVVEFRGTIPNWSAWLEFSLILYYRLTYAPLVSKQERTLTDFVFQVMAWVPLHLIKRFKLTKIIGVEHKVIK